MAETNNGTGLRGGASLLIEGSRQGIRAQRRDCPFNAPGVEDGKWMRELSSKHNRTNGTA